MSKNSYAPCNVKKMNTVDTQHIGQGNSVIIYSKETVYIARKLITTCKTSKQLAQPMPSICLLILQSVPSWENLLLLPVS